MNYETKINALKVHQWLHIWDTVKFDIEDNRERPKPEFLLFSMKAGALKKLSKVYPRRDDEMREIEIGIQRKHDPERSEEISKYVKYGYPLSDMIKDDKKLETFSDLQMPGWLPTVIVANILLADTLRGNKKIKSEDVISINDAQNIVSLTLPAKINEPKWNPDVPPIEIIDGQHRLWSFDPDNKIANEFELPVVAFVNLDITWQAYLFYTINVKPKKINRSLAYDLYPLLRVQEWLEKSPDTAQIYKETRAQEIVEVLWSYSNSPWKDRINLLGDTRKTIQQGKDVPNITQAAFIRNLIASFIKTAATKGLGGLFGAKLQDEYKSPLSWNRTQQASFIIFIWQKMYETVAKSTLEWAKSLRTKAPNQSQLFEQKTGFDDLAFVSSYSLLTSDQGVRGFLHVINDLVYSNTNELEIRNLNWTAEVEKIKEDKIENEYIRKTLNDFANSKLNQFIVNVCSELVKFDWRTSSESNLSEEQRRRQMVFKGSSGYKELRSQLLFLLSNSSNEEIKKTSLKIISELGYGN